MADQQADVKPWHDAPPCPKGCGPIGTPLRNWHRQDVAQSMAKRGHNLYCPACGGSWIAPAEEVARGEAALVAWEALLDAENAAEREHEASIAGNPPCTSRHPDLDVPCRHRTGHRGFCEAAVSIPGVFAVWTAA